VISTFRKGKEGANNEKERKLKPEELEKKKPICDTKIYL
jgi:hypothetical protein